MMLTLQSHSLETEGSTAPVCDSGSLVLPHVPWEDLCSHEDFFKLNYPLHLVNPGAAEHAWLQVVGKFLAGGSLHSGGCHIAEALRVSVCTPSCWPL